MKKTYVLWHAIMQSILCYFILKTNTNTHSPQRVIHTSGFILSFIPLLPQLLHPFMKFVLRRIILWMPKSCISSIVWQELLFHEMTFIVVGILIILAIAQLCHEFGGGIAQVERNGQIACLPHILKGTDRKSTRLNSSHQISSYAAFC